MYQLVNFSRKSITRNNFIRLLKVLSELTPSADGFETYLEIILDASLKRRIIKVSSEIVESGYRQNQTAEEYLEAVERQVYELSTSRKTSDFEHVGVVANQYYAKLEKVGKLGQKVTGLNTGFHLLMMLLLDFNQRN